MATQREDALSLGARLREEERQARAQRILLALGVNGSTDEREFRVRVSDALYKATWDGRTGADRPDRVILDDFCSLIFGCSYEEVMEAWDHYL